MFFKNTLKYMKIIVDIVLIMIYNSIRGWEIAYYIKNKDGRKNESQKYG